MRTTFLLSVSVLTLFGMLTSGAARAAECSDPTLLRDPSPLIELCSTMIADPNTRVEQRVRAFEYRARVYRFAKDFASALADVNAGLSLNAQDAALYSVRAWIETDQNKPGDSWTDHLRALELDPDNPLYYRRLIGFCIDFGLLSNARELLDHTDKVFPKDFQLKLSKAWVFRASYDHHHTALALTEVLQSTTPEEREGIALTWRRKAMWGEVPLQIFLSEALLGGYQSDAAMKAADRALAIRRDAVTLTAHASVLFNWPTDGTSPSRLPAALEEIDEALRDDPGFAHAHATRALILLYMKRPQDALASIVEAIKLDPNEHDYIWRRFRIHRALDDIEAAERDLTEYVKDRDTIAAVVRILKARGYWLESELPETLTPVLRAGLRACARDKGC